MVGLLAGVFLLVAAFSGIGRAARFLPAPVIEGFTAGIAIVIVLQQVPAMLGTSGDGDKAWQSAYDAARSFVAAPTLAAPVMAVGVAALILLGSRWRPTLPMSLLAVSLATVVSHLASLNIARIGELPRTLPAPSVAFFDPGLIGALIPSALAVAALGALESLLSATVADGMTVGQQHDPDRELFGQGLANLVVPLFGGVPATAAIARTAVNVRAGAGSRLAALTHSVVLAAIVLVAAPLVGGIPLAALAGVLLATCVQMIEVGSLFAMIRATRADAVVLLITLIVTVAVDSGRGRDRDRCRPGTAIGVQIRATRTGPARPGRPRQRGTPPPGRTHCRLPDRRTLVLRRRPPVPARTQRDRPGQSRDPAAVADHLTGRHRRPGPRRRDQPARTPRDHRAAIRYQTRT